MAKGAGHTVVMILAGCQSLVEVDGTLVGDPLELASFAATGASLPSAVSLHWVVVTHLVQKLLCLVAHVFACRLIDWMK